MQKIGVIADTHVPDRTLELDPKIIQIFNQARVDVIMHAGDVCSPKILDQLSKIAPVFAVQGNRDVRQLSYLPRKLTIHIGTIIISLIHGHLGKFSFFTQKMCFSSKAFQLFYYDKMLRIEFPSSKIIIFGHTHRSENTWSEGYLLFNPGSASPTVLGKPKPSVGLIHIQNQKEISSEIIPL